MKVLGIYGSPRKGGNTDLLLDRVLEGGASAGAGVVRVYARDLKMRGCLECGGCDRTGSCVVDDDMQPLYPLLREARVVFLAAPMFFYHFPAQVKALIDRVQAFYMGRLRTKQGDALVRFDGGQGYLVSLGATKGRKLFDGAELTAKYFFEAQDKEYAGSLLLRGIENAGDVLADAEAMEKGFRLGVDAVARAAAGEGRTS